MSSTKPGDVVLDPFFGSGTTGAVAKRLGRHFVGVEREQKYIDVASKRIDAVVPADNAGLAVTQGKRAEPRVPIGALIECGMIQPGTKVSDAKGRWTGTLRIDGSVEIAGEAASIHRMGARVQGAEACNGWTFWHFARGRERVALDDVRSEYRAAMKAA